MLPRRDMLFFLPLLFCLSQLLDAALIGINCFLGCLAILIYEDHLHRPIIILQILTIFIFSYS
jgi:hypothetical protein